MAGRKTKGMKELVRQKVWSCAGYIRLSQEDKDLSSEKLESNSIGSQKTMLAEYIKKHEDLILHDWYIDDGYTGTDFERPRFSENVAGYERGGNQLCDCQRLIPFWTKLYPSR